MARLSSISLTPGKVRRLTADDLDHAPSASPPVPFLGQAEWLTPLDHDDPIMEQVVDLARDYGGIIFQGPPGTSKSWYAARVAVTLADGDPERLRFVQFHPSYQYEDFVEGFVPTDDSGFKLRNKHFLELCDRAHKHPDETVVLVIDELSRGDPGRVFGEVLTYIERTRRGILFHLSSGTECVVPDNLLILATMNPLDRGVDEVDAALERRFAKIALEPSPELLQEFLADSGMSEGLQARLLQFFRAVNGRSRRNPHAALGHTYFLDVHDEGDLQRRWEHQLRFHFEKAFRLNPDELEAIFREWDRVLEVPTVDQGDGEGEEDAS